MSTSCKVRWLRAALVRFVRLVALAGLVGLVSVLLCASPASASPPTFAERHAGLKPPDAANETTKGREQRIKQWREHFDLGNAAFDAGDFKGCEAHFAQAWMLNPTAGTAGNLGLCESRLGYSLDAAEHLRHALEAFDSTGKDDEVVRKFRLRTAEELISATKSVGTVHVENAPPGATISIGKRTFAAPLERSIFLYPGDYTLEVRTKADLLYTARVHVIAGQAYTHRVPLPSPREVADPPQAILPDRIASGPSVPLVVAGATGAATFLGVGVGLVVAAQGRLSDAEKLRAGAGTIFGAQTGACHAPAGARVDLCKKLDAATDDGAILEYAGTVAFILSGGLALGTTVYGLWPRAQPPPAKPPPPAGAAVTGVRLAAGSSGAAVMIQGVW